MISLDPQQSGFVKEMVRLALTHLSDLPLAKQADVLDGASLVLNGREAEEAAVAAHHMRIADKATGDLFELL